MQEITEEVIIVWEVREEVIEDVIYIRDKPTKSFFTILCKSNKHRLGIRTVSLMLRGKN